MKELINRSINAAKRYTFLDFALLKVALVFAGIIIGAYFAKFFLNHTLFIWLVFILSYLWIICRTFFRKAN